MLRVGAKVRVRVHHPYEGCTTHMIRGGAKVRVRVHHPYD